MSWLYGKQPIEIAIEIANEIAGFYDENVDLKWIK